MNNSGQNKEVDIRVPAGSLKMGNKVDSKQLEMPVYPGSRERTDTSADSNASNVNLDVASSWFGFKLAVQKYVSADSPDRVQQFYEKELAKFGTVTKSHADVRESDEEYRVELKAGSDRNLRIVAIKPYGTGSSFALVRVKVQE